MNHCKYLMVLNTKFCRLKGRENPRCKCCTVKDSEDARPAGKMVRGLRRLKV